VGSEFPSLESFWPYYVAQHLNPTTRRLHFAGTTAGLLCLAAALALRRGELIPAGLASSYGLAWIGHFFFEKNRPATFQYPLLSLRADFRMYALMWSGRMDGEIDSLKDRLAAFRRS
jgi:hypothetical protein